VATLLERILVVAKYVTMVLDVIEQNQRVEGADRTEVAVRNCGLLVDQATPTFGSSFETDGIVRAHNHFSIMTEMRTSRDRPSYHDAVTGTSCDDQTSL
jgi:hypothetical protein